jgi:hypothetical protein
VSKSGINGINGAKEVRQDASFLSDVMQDAPVQNEPHRYHDDDRKQNVSNCANHVEILDQLPPATLLLWVFVGLRRLSVFPKCIEGGEHLEQGGKNEDGQEAKEEWQCYAFERKS